MDPTVVRLPDQLERLALRIKTNLVKCAEGRQQWIDGMVDIAVDLAKARAELKHNTPFGEWCEANGFGEDIWNKNDRAALIAMGANAETMRKALEATSSQSIQLIYAKEKNSLPSARKTSNKITREQKPHVKATVDRVQALGAAGMKAKDIAAEVGIGERYVHQMLEHDRIHDEGMQDAIGLAAAEALNLTAKKKLEAAIKVKTKLLEREYDQKRMKENTEHWERYFPKMQERENEASRNARLYRDFMAQQKKIFTVEQFKLILMCLHPDGDRSPERRAEAFRLFNAKRFALTGETEPKKAK